MNSPGRKSAPKRRAPVAKARDNTEDILVKYSDGTRSMHHGIAEAFRATKQWFERQVPRNSGIVLYYQIERIVPGGRGFRHGRPILAEEGDHGIVRVTPSWRAHR